MALCFQVDVYVFATLCANFVGCIGKACMIACWRRQLPRLLCSSDSRNLNFLQKSIAHFSTCRLCAVECFACALIMMSKQSSRWLRDLPASQDHLQARRRADGLWCHDRLCKPEIYLCMQHMPDWCAYYLSYMKRHTALTRYFVLCFVCWPGQMLAVLYPHVVCYFGFSLL